MASPVQTSGFQVQARPGIDYLDPRLLTPNTGALLPAVGQGLGLYSGLQQIADEAQSRPSRRRLGDIQLAQAEQALAMAPLEQQRALAQIAEMQQNAAVPIQITEDIALSGGDMTRTGTGDTIDNFQITEELTPRVRTVSGYEIGPGGVRTPFQKTETLATAAQVRADAQKQAAAIEAQRALAAQRSRGKEYEYTQLAELYSNALEDGDNEAASLYKSRIDKLTAKPGILPTGTAFQRRVEQLAADAGVTMASASELAKSAEGMEALAKAAKAARTPDLLPATVTTAERQLLRNPAAADALETEIGDALNPVRPYTVRTKAERDALPAGTEYIGPDGKRYIKK
jgi:hypothetical protein